MEAVWVLRAGVLQGEGVSSVGSHLLHSSVWAAVGVGEAWSLDLVQVVDLELMVEVACWLQASGALASCSEASLPSA